MILQLAEGHSYQEAGYSRFRVEYRKDEYDQAQTFLFPLDENDNPVLDDFEQEVQIGSFVCPVTDWTGPDSEVLGALKAFPDLSTLTTVS